MTRSKPGRHTSKKAEAKARKKLAILRKLAGTEWGANEKVLKTVYQGTVRPHLEYGAAAFSTASKTNLLDMDKVQRQGLRLITGSMKSTPIAAMEKITGIQPPEDRRNMKVQLQAEKFRCQSNHPMKTRLDGPIKNRIKRGSFIRRAKDLDEKSRNNLPTKIIPPTMDIQDHGKERIHFAQVLGP